MRLNSNEGWLHQPMAQWQQQSLAFVGAYLEVKHHLLMNGCMSSIAMTVEEPDRLIIREIESEEEVCSMCSERSFQRFTDEENKLAGGSSDESEHYDHVENSKPDRQTHQSNFDSLRQTAHFSNEDESENKPNHHNKQMSVKERLMHKLLMEKSRLHQQNGRESFNQTLPTKVHYQRSVHDKSQQQPVEPPKPTSSKQTLTKTTRVVFSPSTKNQTKQRPSNFR